jgi:hypothetical protein
MDRVESIIVSSTQCFHCPLLHGRDIKYNIGYRIEIRSGREISALAPYRNDVHLRVEGGQRYIKPLENFTM